MRRLRERVDGLQPLRRLFDEQIGSRRTRRALWFFLLDGLLISASGALVAQYVSLYALEFGANSAQIGLMSTLASLAGLLAMLPGAQITERWIRPRWMVLIFSRALPSIFWLLIGLLPPLAGTPPVAITLILALWTLRATTATAAGPAWAMLSGRIVPSRMRGRYFATRNSVKRVASLLAIPAGWLIERLGFPVGYEVSFTLAAVLGLLDFWAYSRIPFSAEENHAGPVRGEEAGQEEQAKQGTNGIWESPAQKRNFWVFCITSLFWTFSLQFAAPFFSVYQVQELGATASIIGVLSAATSMTALPGQILFGRWLDRRGIRWTLVVSGLLIPLLPLGWLLVRGPWGALPINLGSGFLWAGYNLASFSLLLEVTPETRQTHHIALYRTIVRVGAVAAPLLGGLLVESRGFLTVFVLSGIGRLVSALAMTRFIREPESEEEEKEETPADE